MLIYYLRVFTHISWNLIFVTLGIGFTVTYNHLLSLDIYIYIINFTSGHLYTRTFTSGHLLSSDIYLHVMIVHFVIFCGYNGYNTAKK